MDREVMPKGLITLIKIATRALVAACATQATPGPRRVEEITGKSAGTISRWQGDGYPDLIPTDVIFLLEFSIQAPVFARTLAELTGHRLAPIAIDDPASVDDLAGLTSDLVRVVGSGSRVGAKLGAVLADETVTRREATETLTVIGEHEAVLGVAKKRLARFADGHGRRRERQ